MRAIRLANITFSVFVKSSRSIGATLALSSASSRAFTNCRIRILNESFLRYLWETCGISLQYTVVEEKLQSTYLDGIYSCLSFLRFKKYLNRPKDTIIILPTMNTLRLCKVKEAKAHNNTSTNSETSS